MTHELIFTATYNEVENIEFWITDVAFNRPSASILVVDDNSPDGTSDVVRSLCRSFPQVRLIEREGKLGLDSAHLLAMHLALDEGYLRLVTMDADLSHQPSQITPLVDQLSNGGCVIGTRSRGGTHQARPLRKVLSKGANGLARLALPTTVSEYTSSMRVFSPPALEELVRAQFKYKGYAFFIESIEILHRAGIPIPEAPIDFLDRSGGKSKIPKTQILSSASALTRLALERRKFNAMRS